MARKERKPKFGIKLRNIIEKWGSQFPHVLTWLSKIQAKKLDCWSLYLFCRWAKINPEELYHLKDDKNSTEAENLLDQFVAAETEYTQAVKWRSVQAVKSYFKHNYRSLEPASGKMDLQKIKPYRKPTKAQLRKLWKAAMNPRDRAIITFINSSAIAKETVVNLRWRHFEEGWETAEIPHISIEPQLIKGHGLGRYKGVRQETFLTPEAKKDLLDYREWMTRVKKVQWTKDMYVFIQVHEPFDALGYKNFDMVVRRISQNAGVPFSSHDARRFVETALEETGIHPNWARKIRGRKVRGEEAPYSQPEIEKLRAAYAKAVPLLQFTVLVERPKVTKEEIISELPEELLEPVARKHGLDIGEVRRLLIRKAKERPLRERGLRRLEELTLRRVKRKETQHNGGNCQKIVSEDKLEEFLAQGWAVKAVLPSGKIVIATA